MSNPLSKNKLSKQAQKSTAQLINYVKVHQGFLLPKWKTTSLHLTEIGGESTNTFLQEANYLRTVHGHIKQKAQFYDDLIKKTKWEELLFHFVIYLEGLYELCGGDQLLFHVQRLQCIPILQRISKRKKQLSPTSWTSNNHFEHNLNGIRERIKHSKRTPSLFQSFKAYNTLLDLEHVISMYCFHGWGLRLGDEASIMPHSSKDWERWDSTHSKYLILHRFYELLPFLSASKKFEHDLLNPEVLQLEAAREFLIDLLGTTKVITKNGELDGRHALHAISIAYNHYLRIAEEHILISPFPPRSLAEEISAVKGATTPINETIANNIFDIFSGPLDSEGLEDTLFITTDNNFCLPAPLFYHGDFKTTLMNSCIKYGQDNRRFSNNMELQIANLFQKNGYTTFVGWEHWTENKKDGEVDIFAYKDGHLFIIEAKLTYFRLTPKNIQEHKSKLEYGGRQLSKTIKAIPNRFDEIADILSIPRPFTELTTVPLIVSTSLEFDGYSFSGHPKISLFELQCLLKPQRTALLQITKRNFPDIKEDILSKVFEIKNRMWHTKSTDEETALSPSQLVRAIKTNKIWEDIPFDSPQERRIDLGKGASLRYV